MEQWFEALSLFEKIYWVVALISSAIFVVLIVMTILGGDADDLGGDVDVEIEGDAGIGFQFLSFKNLMGFLTIFGWSGISLLIYIDFLGTTGEINRFMRSTGAMFYFTLTPLAQSLMLYQHYNILRKKPEVSIKPKVLQYQLIILLLMLIIGAISIFLVVTDNITYEIENIVEWNFSLLLNLYFLGMILIWKDYRLAFTNKGVGNK